MIFFAFCVYKRLAKDIFLNIYVNNYDSHQRKTTCTLYIKKSQNCDTFIYIYTKSQTLCKKQDNLRYVLFTKSLTLYVTRFFMKFWDWHLYIYIKHENLRYVTFLYTKRQSLKKKQDNLRYIFLYTVWLKWRAHFAVDILLLHHYKSDLSHLSGFDSLGIVLSKSERWTKQTRKMKD